MGIEKVEMEREWIRVLKNISEELEKLLCGGQVFLHQALKLSGVVLLRDIQKDDEGVFDVLSEAQKNSFFTTTCLKTL